MLGWKARLFFQQLFWTKKEKEFYNIFHVSASMQRAVRKEGYLDLDGMVRAYKIRARETDTFNKEIIKALEEKINGVTVSKKQGGA